MNDRDTVFADGSIQTVDGPVYEVVEGKRDTAPFWLGVVFGMAIALSVFLCVNILAGRGVLPNLRTQGADKLLDQRTREKIALIEDQIEENFYRTDLSDDDLREGLYSGMVGALNDPYSVYYTSEEFAEIMSDIEGVYEGIGAYLMDDDGSALITGTIKGSPAEAAGLLEGDVITRVDGESVKGLDLSSIVSRVRGPHGTAVNLTILRDGEEFDISIGRDRIESPTVSIEDPVDGLGYLKITSFDDLTPDQFKDGLAELTVKGMEGLLLDLRSNTGGNLDAVCEIARQLLPAGVIVYTLDRNGKRQDYTCDGKRAADFPIVVLTNGYTASASEILAGAIRDYGLGKLVGTTTYGKGVVQRIYQMGDGTAVKLTVENYYTPSGFDLNGVGLSPDLEVVYDADAYEESGSDNQRQEGERLVREMMGQ